MTKYVCIDDYERAAKDYLSEVAWLYYTNGAEECKAQKRNRKSFARFELSNVLSCVFTLVYYVLELS